VCRAERLHERGEVVRLDVEQRSCPCLEQESRFVCHRYGPGD